MMYTITYLPKSYIPREEIEKAIESARPFIHSYRWEKRTAYTDVSGTVEKVVHLDRPAWFLRITVLDYSERRVTPEMWEATAKAQARWGEFADANGLELVVIERPEMYA